MGKLTIYLKHGHVLAMDNPNASTGDLDRMRNSLCNSLDTFTLTGPNSVALMRWADIVAVAFTGMPDVQGSPE